jgi:hypothetical protein
MSFTGDIRYAVRTLRRSPAFAAAAVACLALGIGVNTTIFGTVDSMLFRPLPYGAPAGITPITVAGSPLRAARVDPMTALRSH